MKILTNLFYMLFLVTLISVNAEASRSRLVGLGEDANGSFFVDDTRSIFLNPAYIERVRC